MFHAETVLFQPPIGLAHCHTFPIFEKSEFKIWDLSGTNWVFKQELLNTTYNACKLFIICMKTFPLYTNDKGILLAAILIISNLVSLH